MDASRDASHSTASLRRATPRQGFAPAMMWLAYLLAVAIAAVLLPIITSPARCTVSGTAVIAGLAGAGSAPGVAADAHQWRSHTDRPLDRDVVDVEIDDNDDDNDDDADGDVRARLVDHPAAPLTSLRFPCVPDRPARRESLGDPSSLAFGWGLPRGPPTS